MIGPVGVCTVTGKNAYSHYSHAVAALEASKRLKDDFKRNDVYRCPVCRMWHTGRRGERRKHVHKIAAGATVGRD